MILVRTANLDQKETPDHPEFPVHLVNRGRWEFLVHWAIPETKANPDRLVKWG